MSVSYFIFIGTILLTSFGGTYAANCSDPETISYCLNCLTFDLCEANIKRIFNLDHFNLNTRQVLSCSDPQVCIEDGVIAYCDSSADICKCSDGTLSTICDKYDDKIIYSCIDGTIAAANNCSVGQTCQDNKCSSGTKPTTTTPPPCNDNSVSIINCTAFNACHNGESTTRFCEDGNVTEKDSNGLITCVPYIPFSCPPNVIGAIGDHFNCSVFYNCKNGNQLGSAQICPESKKYFDSSIKQCTTDQTIACSAVNKCTPCSDQNLYIGVNCTKFFECIKQEQGYYTILRECPPGFFFNNVTKICTKVRPGGC